MVHQPANGGKDAWKRKITVHESMKQTANAPKNRQSPKRKRIFQPSIFRCELLLLVSGRVLDVLGSMF